MTAAEMRALLNQRLNEFSPNLLQIVFEFVEFLAQRQPPRPTSQASVDPSETDPLIGLFSGSPDLATNAENILQKSATPDSGWTWKQQ